MLNLAGTGNFRVREPRGYRADNRSLLSMAEGFATLDI